MESPIPEHIKAASKELTFPNSLRDYYRATVNFCNFCYNNDLPNFANTNLDSAFLATIVDVDYRLIRHLSPVYKDGMITGFTSILGIYRNRPQTMKAGKYLKKIFPFLTDAQVESWVCNLKAEHMPVEYELITGKDEESFRFAYQEPHTPKRSPSFSRFGFDCSVKRLDSSCMRGDYFPKPEDHPAIVYAAGDLEIVYAKQKGKDTVGARVLTYPAKESFSDIYSADDAATELLVNYLKEKGFTSKGIYGAKVRKIDHPEGYLMPYVDDCETCEDVGVYFRLGYGYINCRSTEGWILSEPENYCDSCCEYVSEELTQVLSGDCVCQSCLESYIYSSLMGGYIPDSDSCASGNGAIATAEYFEDNGYIIDVDGYFQEESECVYYDGEYYHESDYLVTCFEGVYYHKDSEKLQKAIEAKEKADIAYQTITTTTLQWTKMEERNATPYLDFVTVKERTLRDNYQLNAQGEPVRIPDFLAMLESV